jgi:hypothetical protein
MLEREKVRANQFVSNEIQIGVGVKIHSQFSKFCG